MTHIIDDLLRELVRRDASDLHIKVGNPPLMRIHGSLNRIEAPPMNEEQSTHMLLELLSPERRERLNTFKEVDLSYYVEGASRFRVNMFWQRGKIGAVFRVIPFKIRTLEDLNMPKVCSNIALLPRGLVLVTGPTGSGKSTSLAAMINHININRKSHIMTIEDPIEYVHADNRSIINQRELGTDTHSFADALKHVMRQNPDVILVGEMRDLETIQLAITAAETGHLVFSTLHTVDAAQTMDRIVDVFPPAQQEQIRTQLGVTIQAVISQTLLPTMNNTGRVAAFEVMLATPAIRTLIREGKTHQLYSMIQTSGELGMQTLDWHLLKLVTDKRITFDSGLGKASNAIEFARRAAAAGVVEAQNAAH